MIHHSFTKIPLFLLSVLLCAILYSCSDQEPDNPQQVQNGNRKSPIAIASVKYDGTYIKVIYGQPYRRDQTVFGDLEPWGEVWRTGANEATEITLTKTVLMGDQAIRPGTYALFTIPEPDSFTVILNHELGQWGAYNYKPERDYKRMKFPTYRLPIPVEAFTVDFTAPQQSMTTMTLRWDFVQVDIPIRFYGE
ncbi:MAG: DUF2911 domain-containing protein [Gracilimonas sp.]|uniref:DUF2911 domain-containing protein n=1 Tax=Gracilimonas sp. TaxID=1974203 RepID=UPI00375004FE|nr:DUF2911 domain-containing protein [Gracilimonas sp.]